MHNRLIMMLPDREENVSLSAGDITIGRDYDNDIQITSEVISRHHARISNFKYVCELEDLSSKNGTFVNGKKITSLRLNNADEIRIGDVKMRFEITDREGSEDLFTVNRDYSSRSGLATVNMRAHPDQQANAGKKKQRAATKHVKHFRPLRPKNKN